MKWLGLGLLVLGFSTSAWADSEMRFLVGYDARIQRLEKYTVTFSDGSSVAKPATPSAHSAAPAAETERDHLVVKLIPAHRS